LFLALLGFELREQDDKFVRNWLVDEIVAERAKHAPQLFLDMRLQKGWLFHRWIGVIALTPRLTGSRAFAFISMRHQQPLDGLPL